VTIPVLMGNPPAHLPATGTNVHYRLGSSFQAAAMDVWWNRTESSGLISVVGEPEGWEAVVYNTPLDQVGGRDGALSGPVSRGPKTLEIRSVVVAPDGPTLRHRLAAIKTLLREVVVWDQYDWGAGERLGMVCRAQGEFRPTPPYGHALGGIASRVNFDLVAPTPVKYSVGDASSLELSLPLGTVTGRTYNYTYPWSYGGVVIPGGTGIALNRGDEPTWPVFRVVGPVTNAVIQNETTGQEFTLVGLVPNGQEVEINARSGTVTPSTYRLISRPWSLAPGPNTIRWRVTSGTTEPEARLFLTWRSAWQ
jgi:tail protein